MSAATVEPGYCRMPSIWLPGLVNPSEEHVLQTCDGVPRECPAPDGPVPVAVCRAWLTTDPAARRANTSRCQRCGELVGVANGQGS